MSTNIIAAINEEQDFQQWPSLTIISKTLEAVPNGTNRRQFPNHIFDKSILLTCQLSEKEKKKVRHAKLPNTINANSHIFLTRSHENEAKEENCSFLVSLDSILTEEPNMDSDCIMISDVRDHSVASKCLPEEVTGYWIRIFGPKNTFIFQISLWQVIHQGKKSHQGVPGQLMKVNELKIKISNEGPTKKLICTKKQRPALGISSTYSMKNITGSFHTPTFCSVETYLQITSSLNECLENGKMVDFCELYEGFCRTATEEGDRDSIEMKLLLSIEKSQYYATKGDFVKAKRILQRVVGSVVSKSPNKIFLLNRAYSFLANVHLMEGNSGTAEDCLNVLQIDKRNGVSYGDLGFFHLLHGQTMMNFSKKHSGLQENLQKESLSSFVKAEKSLEQALPLSFHNICKMNLFKAQLYICEHYGKCCGSNIEKALNFIENVEQYNTISLQTKCHLQLAKSECLFFEGKILEAENMIENCKEIAEGNFPRFIVLCDTFQSRRININIEKSCSNGSDLNLDEIEDVMYDADESS